jgi:hypothetical protein
MKNPPAREGLEVLARLSASDVLCLETFGALDAFKLNGLALIQGAISVFLDHRVMDEYVLACAALNESVTFCAVKPLNCSLFSHNVLLSPLSQALESLAPARSSLAAKSGKQVQWLSVRSKAYFKETKAPEF